jgi:glycosyltransferase involved in cell wall biosynthesis
MQPLISATIICNNEEEHIAECLGSLKFCDEIVVVDSFSTDRTAEIAASMGARVCKREYKGTNDQKEYARGLATGAWIVNLDGDEAASEGFGDELRSAIERGGFTAYSVPFEHYFHGRKLRYGRFRSDRHVRLFLREAAHYDTGVEPHDRLVYEGGTGRLSRVIRHFTYEDIGDAAEKCERYGRLAYDRLVKSGKNPSPLSRYGSPPWRFVKEGFLEMGFLDGATGLKLAMLSAREAYIKYGGGQGNA